MDRIRRASDAVASYIDMIPPRYYMPVEDVRYIAQANFGASQKLTTTGLASRLSLMSASRKANKNTCNDSKQASNELQREAVKPLLQSDASKSDRLSLQQKLRSKIETEKTGRRVKQRERDLALKTMKHSANLNTSSPLRDDSMDVGISNLSEEKDGKKALRTAAEKLDSKAGSKMKNIENAIRSEERRQERVVKIKDLQTKKEIVH